MVGKYSALIIRLTNIYEREKERYPIENLIIGFCGVDTDNSSYFSKEDCINSIPTVQNFFWRVAQECKYFDYRRLKRFVYGSECEDAKKLMEQYISEVDKTIINALNLQTQYEDAKKYNYGENTAKIFIKYREDKLSGKEIELILDTVERCLKLSGGSLQMQDIIRNCIILVCKIQLKVKDYLLKLELTTYELRLLSDRKIQSLILDDEMQIKIPSNCDNKVCVIMKFSVSVEITS